MKRSTYRPFALLAVFVLIVSMACNMLSSETATPAAPPVQEATPAQIIEATPVQELPTDEPEDSGAVDSLEGVETATIRIEAKGDFVYPEGDYGMIYDQVGSGTGFIINSEGIAVTNNHVVTGADSVKVYFSNDDEAYNAKVLGVSECSDLAVIDIEGDGYPFLDWYDGDIKIGMDVWSAGYPLGDPEYSLHSGGVSKREASLATDWTSVDKIIEHDAVINPGNSGGPLVNEDGQVVAVNYATTSAAVGQFYAIAREEALDIIEDLQSGQDITSIGINGFAFVTEDQSMSGIWVYSVDTGSPAYDAGIRGGDIVTELEGSLMGTDGTKREYCEILRSHNEDDAMSVRVWRLSTGEVLEGTLNSDDELAYAGDLNLGGGTSNSGSNGAVEVVDDFEADYGNFEVFNGAEVYDGLFYLGKFQDCADVGEDTAFGCFSTCLTCGSAMDYDMQVEVAYADGVSERTFGIVLRFVDFNGNGLVDSEDYYLDLEISVFDKWAVVWEHVPGEGWNDATGYLDSIKGGSKWNTLGATASNGGSQIDVFVNGTNVYTATGLDYTEGTVGLVMGGRAAQAAFDNFVFIPAQ